MYLISNAIPNYPIFNFFNNNNYWKLFFTSFSKLTVISKNMVPFNTWYSLIHGSLVFYRLFVIRYSIEKKFRIPLQSCIVNSFLKCNLLRLPEVKAIFLLFIYTENRHCAKKLTIRTFMIFKNIFSIFNFFRLFRISREKKPQQEMKMKEI